MTGEPVAYAATDTATGRVKLRRDEITVRAGMALGMGVATGGWEWARDSPHMAQ